MSPRTPRALVRIAITSLPLAVASAQGTVYELHGLGPGAAPVGDFDHDGITDLVIGSDVLVSGRTGAHLAGKLAVRGLYPNFLEPSWSERNQHGLGDLDGDGIPEVENGEYVYSGAELLAPPVARPSGYGAFRPLFGFQAPAGNMGFLGSAVPLDDLDGDGLPELLLGWPDACASRCPSDHPRIVVGATLGAATLCSAASPAPLLELHGDTTSSQLGGLVARLGDLDHDGFDDFAVATRMIGTGYFCNFTGGNRVRVHSAKLGTLLWELPAAPAAIAALDDVDHDGTPDVALGFPYASAVELRSGAGGALIVRITHPAAQGFDLFGYRLERVADLDGDGRHDLAIAAPQPFTYPIGLPGDGSADGPGHVNVLGTRSLTLIQDLAGTTVGEEFGADVDYLGDVDRNGSKEILVESRRAEGGSAFHARSLRGIVEVTRVR